MNRLLILAITILLLLQIILSLFIVSMKEELDSLRLEVDGLKKELFFLRDTYISNLINQSISSLVETMNKTFMDSTYIYPSFIVIQKLENYLLMNSKGDILLESTSASKVIQKGIDQIVNGGLILIKPGVYILDSPVYLKSKVAIVGEGYPELVVSKNSDGLIIPENSAYIVIEGIKIRGSRESSTGALLRIRRHGFTIRIRNVELYNHYDGLVIEGGYPPSDFWGIIIEGVHIHDVNNVGLTINGYGNVLYVKETNIAYSGNICILLKDTGDGVMEFINVHCFNSGKYSVLAYNTDPTIPVQHKRFIACHLEGIDMRPQTSRFVNCINIAFLDVEIAGMLGHGIEFINCRDVRYIGGRIINNGIGSPGTYAGIYIKDSSSIIVSNVFIYDTNPPGSKTQGYGILEDGYSNYNIFVNNVLKGNAVEGIITTGTHTIAQGNIV